MPVNVWPRGADWMTLSLAKFSCDGATIDNPGGTLFLRDEIPGVLTANALFASFSLSEGPSPFADCCCRRASMRCLCCSRTDKLLCTCSFMTGSWVTKPGERQAKPTSWICSPSRAVKGRAVAGEPELGAFLDKSSLRGRCRFVGSCSGEPGSFFTIILGGPPTLRELFDSNIDQQWEG